MVEGSGYQEVSAGARVPVFHEMSELIRSVHTAVKTTKPTLWTNRGYMVVMRMCTEDDKPPIPILSTCS